jgi:hypothetical protein
LFARRSFGEDNLLVSSASQSCPKKKRMIASETWMPHLTSSDHGWAWAVSAALLIVAGCGAAPVETSRGDAGQARPLSVRVLDSGSRSGVTSQQESVVRGPEEWQRLWQAHQGGAVPQRPLPAVDFARELCISIFAGQRSTGGFAVMVEQVMESASGIEVSYRVTSPPPGAIVSQALTSPFQIIAVASRPGPVRFRRLPES